MPIWYGGKDLLSSPAQVIANTVNLRKVMGKGLAKTIRDRYINTPYFSNHSAAIDRGDLKIGRPYLHESPYGTDKYRILDIPTKDDWRNPSTKQYIVAALNNIAKNYKTWGINSIGMPLIGTGKDTGQLSKQDVGRLIEQILGKYPDLDVYLSDYDMGGYEPVGGWKDKPIQPTSDDPSVPSEPTPFDTRLATAALMLSLNRPSPNPRSHIIKEASQLDPEDYYLIATELYGLDPKEVQDAVSKIEQYKTLNNLKVMSLFDEGFPRKRLLAGEEAVPFFYYRGNPALLNNKSVAAIGTRDIRPQYIQPGTDAVRKLAEDGHVIVSGLARGSDAVAHRAALGTPGNTIAVLSTDLGKRVYPYEHDQLAKDIVNQGGLLMSEFGPFNEPKDFKNDLAKRSRTQALLGDKVLVLDAEPDMYNSAKIGRGTRHAVGHAQSLNKPVYTLKGHYFDGIPIWGEEEENKEKLNVENPRPKKKTVQMSFDDLTDIDSKIKANQTI